jgi:hypothetical protein
MHASALKVSLHINTGFGVLVIHLLDITLAAHDNGGYSPGTSS